MLRMGDCARSPAGTEGYDFFFHAMTLRCRGSRCPGGCCVGRGPGAVEGAPRSYSLSPYSARGLYARGVGTAYCNRPFDFFGGGGPRGRGPTPRCGRCGGRAEALSRPAVPLAEGGGTKTRVIRSLPRASQADVARKAIVCVAFFFFLRPPREEL